MSRTGAARLRTGAGLLSSVSLVGLALCTAACGGCVGVIGSSQLTLGVDVRAECELTRNLDSGQTTCRLALRTIRGEYLTAGNYVRLDNERVTVNGKRLRWTDEAMYTATIPVAAEYTFTLHTPEGEQVTDLGSTPELVLPDDFADQLRQVKIVSPLKVEIEAGGRGDVSLHARLTQERGELGSAYAAVDADDSGCLVIDMHRNVRSLGHAAAVFLPGPARLEIRRVRALQQPLAGFADGYVHLVTVRTFPVELLREATAPPAEGNAGGPDRPKAGVPGNESPQRTWAGSG